MSHRFTPHAIAIAIGLARIIQHKPGQQPAAPVFSTAYHLLQTQAASIDDEQLRE